MSKEYREYTRRGCKNDAKLQSTPALLSRKRIHQKAHKRWRGEMKKRKKKKEIQDKK
jgi:hypothetical protein